MKLVILILFISVISSAIAQTAVFDRNCESYAREKKFIHPKSVLDLDKNTERYYFYDNLTPAYGKMVDEVNKFAPGYYKKPDRAPLHTCSSAPLNKCLPFQAYCTETIAKAAVQEDLAEWKVVATNCQNPKYRAQNPKNHCKHDAVEQLQYVYDQTLWLAKHEARKNPDAARFFKESAKEFAKYRDNLKALLAEQDRLEKARQEQLRQKQLQKELAQSMKNCADIVRQDDNDVENRNIVGRVVVGFDCKDSLATLNQPQLNELKEDIDHILDHMSTKVVLNEANAIALEKSSSAYWASARQLDGTALETEAKALELICKEEPSLCKNPASKKTLSDTYKKNKQKFQKIAPLSEAETNRLLQNEFNPLVAEVNKYCRAANEEWFKLQSEQGAERLKNEQAMYAQKVDNLRVAKPMRVDLLIDKKTPLPKKLDEKPSLLSAAHVSLQDKFSELLNSKLGHLMMAKSLQKKVGVFSGENFRKNCAGGSGTLLNPATLADMQTAKKDFKQLLADELDKVDDAHDAGGAMGRKKALETYLKNNPLTIAELLKKNPSPEYSKLMCHLIRDINESDEDWAQFKTGVAVVGTVASVALAATGVGAPAGALLFATVTATTVISASASLDDYFEAKTEERYARQAGATNQDTKAGALATAQKQEDKKVASFKEFGMTILAEAGGFGFGKALKYLKGPKNPSALTHAIDDAAKLTDDVVESADDVGKVADDVVENTDEVASTPALSEQPTAKQIEDIEVEYEVPHVKVKTRAPSQSHKRLDYDKLEPDDKRYYDFIIERDPGLERVIPTNSDDAVTKLAKMHGNNKPKDMQYLLDQKKVTHWKEGGEAKIYLHPSRKDEVLKVWKPNRLDDFEESTRTVMHFERKVEKNAKLAEYLHVSKIKEKGPNYIVKEFFPNSIEMKKVVDPKELKKMKAAIDKIKKELMRESDAINQKLFKKLNSGSENIHWDPGTGKIVLIDALGF